MVERVWRAVGGRKFVAFILGITMAFVLCLLGRIDGNAFVATFVAGLGVFSAANVTQKATAKRGGSAGG